MRPPERIPLILERLRLAWEKHPDLRLGQLVFNACRKAVEKQRTYEDLAAQVGRAAFSIEDEALVQLIEG